MCVSFNMGQQTLAAKKQNAGTIYSRGVKPSFTEGHISIMVALIGPVVSVWLSSKGQF